VPDFKSHSFELIAHLMVPKAQHLDSLFSEKPVSLFIPGPLVRETVSAAVEFHRQLRQRAIEIQEVDAACVLPADFEVVEAMVTQQTP
jgi:hypothetical protein